MKKYRIAIEETLRKVVEIEAETPGLAVCRAEDEYNEEKHGKHSINSPFHSKNVILLL